VGLIGARCVVPVCPVVNKLVHQSSAVFVCVIVNGVLFVQNVGSKFRIAVVNIANSIIHTFVINI
jgi:hypothetical protein